MYYERVMKPLVTGATGFIGQQLCKSLRAPNVLTRRPETVPAALASAACFRWDPSTEAPPIEALDGCDTVFHLAGEPVAEGRWNDAKKARIRDSRVVGTKNLVAGLGQLDQPPKVMVSASAVGFYGSRGNEILSEDSPPSSGFLADVCQEWENAAAAATGFGTRVVTVRIGMVLGKSGGGLAKMLPLFRLGLGGPLGSGRHWMPWIHVKDLVRLFVFAAAHEGVQGPMNGVAPNPVTNQKFTRALGRAVRRPAVLPAPAFALRLGLGGFAEVLLASQRVTPGAALGAGFKFDYDDIDSALAAL